MPSQVRRAALDCLQAALGLASVVLQRADRRHHDDRAGHEPADAADDVEELLHPHVRAEAALGHHVVAELEADAVGDQRVVPVRDVGERAAVDQSRLALERLDQVGLERIFEHDRHRPGRPQLLGGDRLALERVARR